MVGGSVIRSWGVLMNNAELKRAHTLLYKPFPYFASTPSGDPGSEYVRDIEQLIDQGRYTSARSMAQKLIQATLDGLRYLET